MQLLRLEELYETHHRAVIGLAFNLLHNHEDAEDVAQDVFLAAWRFESSYSPDRGSLRTWLLGMVRHRCIDHLRARARQARSQAAADLAKGAAGDDAAQRAVEAVDATTVLGLLQRVLPDDQAHAVELAYVHGLSQSEIAELLGLPLGTVKSRMRNALLRLRPVYPPANLSVV